MHAYIALGFQSNQNSNKGSRTFVLAYQLDDKIRVLLSSNNIHKYKDTDLHNQFVFCIKPSRLVISLC